ncbi:putative ribokinase [Datura stramonium]|uniref:Ribokinase n=1 Tax=Datura stramonium TaxID=4076 RepID=A0ABS8SXN3_DATST|nr:putative ribokinase [Datura stramonium]
MLLIVMISQSLLGGILAMGNLPATDNFSPGGHAEVYKGCLSDGQVIAVKKITKQEKNDEDKVDEFLSELGIIAHINHPNAAKLIGYSADVWFVSCSSVPALWKPRSLIHGAVFPLKTSYAKPLLQKNNIKEIADPRLGDDYDVVEMKRAMFTALSCLHHLPDIRPNMKKQMVYIFFESAGCSAIERCERPVNMKQRSMGGREH